METFLKRDRESMGIEAEDKKKKSKGSDFDEAAEEETTSAMRRSGLLHK